MEITILGCNSSVPRGDRRPSAQFLKTLHHAHLIDCGEGTLFQLMQFKCKYSKLKNIFISHLHGDHIFGIFGLINQLKIEGRKELLTIYSPKGLKEIVQMQWKHSKSEIYYPIEFVEINTKKNYLLFEDEELKVSTIPLIHRLPTAGFLFQEKNNSKNVSYAYCSDTVYNESIIPIIRSTNTLYHESTFINEHLKRAKETGHSTAEEAATIAQKANVKKLIIGHYSSRYDNFDQLLYEAKFVFKNTFAAYEGLQIKFEQSKDEIILN